MGPPNTRRKPQTTIPSGGRNPTFSLSAAELGAHTVVESAVAGWSLTGLECTGAGSTLGVTWFTMSTPEADMALNTSFTWKSTCGSSGGSGYDVETVFLHENGHVAGLDHARRTDSVMYPSYQAPRCTLFDYDKRSIANLY